MDRKSMIDWLMRQQLNAGDRALSNHRNGDKELFHYNLGMKAAFGLIIDFLENKEKAAKQ